MTEPHGPFRNSWHVILALGITQIVGYGSVFYSFSLLMEPLQQALFSSKSTIVGAFSTALLVSGICATFIGRTIDRIGGRVVMAAGSSVAAILLSALSRVSSVMELYVLYAGLGVAMAAILYEPAFAVLTQIFGPEYRRAISALTLLGGLASSVFWPLTQQLILHFGWRNALLILAACNAMVCVPVHLLMLPKKPAGKSAAKAVAGVVSKSLKEVLREPTFYWLGAALVANGLIFTSMAVHMMPILQSKGLSAAAAAGIGALLGPMQVTGRILELTVGKRYSILGIGRLAFCLVPIALLIFAVATQTWLLVAFVLCYGLSNGVITIVRGAVPAELFGRDHYGAVAGALATPNMLAQAFGPFLASLLWMATGGNYDRTLITLAVIAFAGVGFFIVATRGHMAASRRMSGTS
jgi:MFS family permease